MGRTRWAFLRNNGSLWKPAAGPGQQPRWVPGQGLGAGGGESIRRSRLRNNGGNQQDELLELRGDIGAYKIISQIPAIFPLTRPGRKSSPGFAPGVIATKYRNPLRRGGARSGPGIEICSGPDKRQGGPDHPMGKRPDRKGGPRQNRSSRQSLACRNPRHHRVGQRKHGEEN